VHTAIPAVSIPEPILASDLMRQGGFVVFEGLPDAETCARLYAEAAERYPNADVQECRDDDLEELRGGRPGRALLSAEAGPVQDALYAAGWLTDFLASTCGVPVVPSGNRGSFSYYARPADHLALHRDIESCDLTLITVLHDNTDPTDPAGALVLYPERIHEPLSAIRERPGEGAFAIKLQPGQSIVFYGGVVPHEVTPVREGQLRIISALCFRAMVD